MVTTKSNRLHPDEVMKRETRFKDVHWKKMIAKGTQVFKADEHDSSQARGIILSLLDRLDTGNMPVLDIQRELVDGRKTIRQTLAWKAAKQLLSAWNMPMRDLRRVRSKLRHSRHSGRMTICFISRYPAELHRHFNSSAMHVAQAVLVII